MLTLFDLSWSDLLLPLVLPLLTVEDLFRLRATSRQAHNLVTEFFATARKIALTSGRNCTPEALKVRAKCPLFANYDGGNDRCMHKCS
jgi:hypothetical protein